MSVGSLQTLYHALVWYLKGHFKRHPLFGTVIFFIPSLLLSVLVNMFING